MQFIEGKKLIHKDTKEVLYYNTSKTDWYKICYTKNNQEHDGMYNWLEVYNVYDIMMLESNNGEVFELPQIYTEN